MKTLKVEDWRKVEGGFKVLRSTGTIEWIMGDYITVEEMTRILSRHGANAVRVDIVPRK